MPDTSSSPTSGPRIGLIWAQAHGGVIGKAGVMPWHLPEDLAHFKRITLGAPVIMGRKTWDSLPPRFRPLPGRTNVVITRQDSWQAAGAQRATSLPNALAQCDGAGQVWIIGGAQIYAQALPLAHSIAVTEIDATFSDGDAFAPSLHQLGPDWQAHPGPWQVATSGLRYRFVLWQRAASD